MRVYLRRRPSVQSIKARRWSVKGFNSSTGYYVPAEAGRKRTRGDEASIGLEQIDQLLLLDIDNF